MSRWMCCALSVLMIAPPMPARISVPPDGIVKTQLMEIFVRRNGQWWIEAYHNVDVKPPAASQMPK